MSAAEIAIPLAAGTVHIRINRADWPLEALCSFAARDNPRRAFLVVSKVLGRHIPVKPAVMRASFVALAAKIPADLPGPVVIIGLAETAICLGQGVHEEYVKRSGRDDILFLHSTRQMITHPVLARFEEPHSHASTHLIYRAAALDDHLANPRSLVIVDDEISTGTTVLNLAAALCGALPSLSSITVLSLADWSGDQAWQSQAPRTLTVGSLLAGTLRWEAGLQPVAARDAGKFDRRAQSLGTLHAHNNFGRVGRTDTICNSTDMISRLSLPPNAQLRVLGTGEFTYPPFRLAEALEAAGHDVVVQSTTRSPAHLDGAMKSVLRFADNYQTGVPNYLYNVVPGDGRMTLICHETPPDSIDPRLVAVLQARTLFFGATV